MGGGANFFGGGGHFFRGGGREVARGGTMFRGGDLARESNSRRLVEIGRARKLPRMCAVAIARDCEYDETVRAGASTTEVTTRRLFGERT